ILICRCKSLGRSTIALTRSLAVVRPSEGVLRPVERPDLFPVCDSRGGATAANKRRHERSFSALSRPSHAARRRRRKCWWLLGCSGPRTFRVDDQGARSWTRLRAHGPLLGLLGTSLWRV